MPAGAACMRKVERGGHGNGEALPQKVPCLGAVLGCLPRVCALNR